MSNSRSHLAFLLTEQADGMLRRTQLPPPTVTAVTVNSGGHMSETHHSHRHASSAGRDAAGERRRAAGVQRWSMWGPTPGRAPGAADIRRACPLRRELRGGERDDAGDCPQVQDPTAVLRLSKRMLLCLGHYSPRPWPLKRRGRRADRVPRAVRWQADASTAYRLLRFGRQVSGHSSRRRARSAEGRVRRLPSGAKSNCRTTSEQRRVAVP
jgi:hypothetical protein